MNNATTSTPIPALLSVLFNVNGSQTSLCLRGHCTHFDQITVIHESEAGVKDHALAGDDVLLSLPVSDGDALIVLARNHEGAIVGCGFYEVSMKLIKAYGVILAPQCTSNLIIDQCDGSVVERGNLRSLQALFTTPETATVR